jgi:hypothetical protein
MGEFAVKIATIGRTRPTVPVFLHGKCSRGFDLAKIIKMW